MKKYYTVRSKSYLTILEFLNISKYIGFLNFSSCEVTSFRLVKRINTTKYIVRGGSRTNVEYALRTFYRISNINTRTYPNLSFRLTKR